MVCFAAADSSSPPPPAVCKQQDAQPKNETGAEAAVSNWTVPPPENLGHEVTMETHCSVAPTYGEDIAATSDDDDDSSSICTLEDDIVHFHQHKKDTTGAASWVATIKTIVSGALLLFCLTLLTAAMFGRQTRATSEAYGWPPVVAFMLFWVVLLWLAIIEGGLNCLVGLRPLPGALYKDSHPLAFRATQLCYDSSDSNSDKKSNSDSNVNKKKKNNLERFIVGRQYMDLTMVFTISFLATAIKGASVLGLPDLVCTVFLNTGLAMTLVTIVLGQLALQINAANCMLDYMNNYAMLCSTYLALAVEASGICHVVYLVQRIATRNKRRIQQQQQQQQQEQDTTTASTSSTSLWKSFAFWSRVALSATLLVFSLITVFVATLQGNTKMFDGVPAWASVLLFVFLILLVGMMDALQIALMAVVHIPQDQLEHRPRALRNANYVIKERRLQSFLLGRQIGQTVVQFLLARITTLDVPLDDDEQDNIWGVADVWQKLFNGGVLGAIIATVLASLIWRVLASEFPLAFLSLPVSRPIIVLCLWAERTGVIQCAWALAALHRKVTGVRPDEYYLGDTDYYREHHPHHHHHHNHQQQHPKATALENKLQEQEEADPTLRCYIEEMCAAMEEDPASTTHTSSTTITPDHDEESALE